MIIWIIMGVLVAVIVTFMVFMAIKDKLKIKKQKEEEKKLKVKQKSSIKNVLVYIEEIFLHNDKLLRDFEPSIGKLKMSDIKNQMKKILTKFNSSNIFLLAKELKENQKIIDVFEKMKAASSTTWNRKLKDEILLVKKEVKKLDLAFVKKQRMQFKKRLKGYLK